MPLQYIATIIAASSSNNCAITSTGSLLHDVIVRRKNMQEDQCVMLKSKGTLCDVPVRSKASSLRVWSSFTYRRNDNNVGELSTNQENSVSVGRPRDGRNYSADFNVRLLRINLEREYAQNNENYETKMIRNVRKKRTASCKIHFLARKEINRARLYINFSSLFLGSPCIDNWRIFHQMTSLIKRSNFCPRAYFLSLTACNAESQNNRILQLAVLQFTVRIRTAKRIACLPTCALRICKVS